MNGDQQVTGGTGAQVGCSRRSGRGEERRGEKKVQGRGVERERWELKRTRVRRKRGVR